MKRYLLDTDICSYIMKRSHPNVVDKLKTVSIDRVTVSVITEAELLYGIKLSGAPKRARTALDDFLRHVQVIEWTRSAAEHYADIRADLHRKGRLIGANDLMIAAHGRSLDAIVVTNNIREFSRVKGLLVENWV